MLTMIDLPEEATNNPIWVQTLFSWVPTLVSSIDLNTSHRNTYGLRSQLNSATSVEALQTLLQTLDTINLTTRDAAHSVTMSLG